MPRASAFASLVRMMMVALRSGTRTNAARFPSAVAYAASRVTPR